MKTIYRIYRNAGIAATGLALLVSCSTLDQTAKSSMDNATVYGNETLTRYAINGIYEVYPSNSFNTDYFLYYGLNTDMEGVKNRSLSEIPNICRYDIATTCSKLNYSSTSYLFGGHFRGIERANIALRSLEKYGNIENNSIMAALYAEALTLRAMIYADLLNVYGEVPARFEPVTIETTYLPKSDKDVIFKQILSDLEKASTMIEPYSNQTLITRVGRACCYGMYARLALQAAGYSRRPDEGKVNTGDLGSVRKSTDPALQAEVLFPKALAFCEDVIENAGLSLYENYEDLWKFYCNLETEAGHEIIFGLPLGNTGWHMIRNAVPDAHYFSPNSANSAYNGIQPNLFFKFDPEDQRRDVTCYPTEIGVNGQADPTKMNINYWYYGKYRFDWRKVDKLTLNSDYDAAKYTYLRYADILLMAAELANEVPEAQGGGLVKAKSYMRPVLARAYKSTEKADKYLANLTDHDSFFEAIKEQRGFEFAGEMLRRQDLIRWGILKQALDECSKDMEDLKNLRGRYNGMKNVIYYRYKANGVDLELYGTNPKETENKTVTDPQGGWTEKKNFYSGLLSASYDRLYINNPDEKMYRPIPETVITANLGVLKNDYGY